MDLKDFIQSAVSQIVEGMVAAQATAAAHGATLTPPMSARRTARRRPAKPRAAARVSTIAFDVAVTAVESAGADGGTKLQVAGGGAEMQARGEHVTRLQFSCRSRFRGAAAALGGDGARFGIPSDGRERRQHLVAELMHF
jgi:hypothetical protein